VLENQWSGREDSNLRPLPPEDVSPRRTRRIYGVVGYTQGASDAACSRVVPLKGSDRTLGHCLAMTSRQSEVAELVAFGLSNKQIARALGISPATVKCHVHEILTKLGVPRRGGVGWALA
jgi:hypothetical protein